MLALVMALALGGGACSVDSDCSLHVRANCLCCPVSDPLNREEVEKDRKLRAVIGPCKEPSCDKVKCAPEIPSVPKCHAGRCVKVPKGP